jgi:hypothetical protein
MEYIEQDLLSYLSISTANVIAALLPEVFRKIIISLQSLHNKGFIHRSVTLFIFLVINYIEITNYYVYIYILQYKM